MAETYDGAGAQRTAPGDPGTGTTKGAKPGTGVDFQHRDYKRMADVWRTCRDVSLGQRAVHAGGTRYLPTLKDELKQDYQARLMRTPFYNASWRTIAGLRGMMFRKPPKVDAPAAVTEMLKDVTMSGISLELLAQTVAEEALTLGRVGVLVDYPMAPESKPGSPRPALTLADAALLKLRPKMGLYKAETIINWRQEFRGNAYVLTLVVLCEWASKHDEFAETQVEQRRVLRLDASGNYFQQIYERDRRGVFVQTATGDLYPQMNSKNLTFIPFAFIGPDDATPEVDDPPLIDLFDMNLSHFRTRADYEHGCHFTGLPTPVVAGYRAKPEEKFYIGSLSAWVFPDPTAHASYLEFSGAGMSALKENMADKVSEMAALGARMLEPRVRGVESAETAGIHRAGEEAMLASVGTAISIGLSKAVKWFSDWAGGQGKAEITLNDDYYPTQLDPAMILSIMQSWQAGMPGFSDQNIYDKFQRGGFADPDVTLEEEQARIKAHPPPQPKGAGPGPGDLAVVAANAARGAAKGKAQGAAKAAAAGGGDNLKGK